MLLEEACEQTIQTKPGIWTEGWKGMLATAILSVAISALFYLAWSIL